VLLVGETKRDLRVGLDEIFGAAELLPPPQLLRRIAEARPITAVTVEICDIKINLRFMGALLNESPTRGGDASYLQWSLNLVRVNNQGNSPIVLMLLGHKVLSPDDGECSAQPRTETANLRGTQEVV
jgi:hypothetical protein